MRHIALLRGINVGGHRKLPMADLRVWLTDAGFTDVRTYIQSGNVVLTSAMDDPAPRVSKVILERGGLDVPVVALPADTLPGILSRDPFPQAGDKHLHVGILLEGADRAGLEALAAKDNGDDTLVVEKVLWLHTPGGLGRSKLANQIGRVGGQQLTMRNRATLLKLIGMV